MINRQELVQTLKGQHRLLQADLGEAIKGVDSGMIKETLNSLVKFKADLVVHLDLENGTFYPDYLKNSNEQEKIKKFMNEMIAIGETVMGFLNKYDTVEKITEAKDTFSPELKKIVGALNLRIEMEEEGLYDVYAA